MSDPSAKIGTGEKAMTVVVGILVFVLIGCVLIIRSLWKLWALFIRALTLETAVLEEGLKAMKREEKMQEVRSSVTSGVFETLAGLQRNLRN